MTDRLTQTFTGNGYATKPGANLPRALDRARDSAVAHGPEPLADRPMQHARITPPAAPTLTDENGQPITETRTAPAGSTDADTTEQQWAAAVRNRAAQIRLENEARELYQAWRVQQTGVQPRHGISLAEFLSVADEDATYRIDDLLPMGGRALLAAQQKAGKTSLLAALLRSLVDGADFLGRYGVQPVDRVDLFDTELDERMLRRWLRRQGIANMDRIRVHSLRGRLSTFDFRDPTLRRHWLAELRGSDFVVLDCLRPVLDTMGLSEHTEAGAFLVAWDELLNDAGVDGAVVAHHMGHEQERARGDSRLLDWPDVNWKIVKESQTTVKHVEASDERRFFSANGRDVDVPEQLLVLDEDGSLTLQGGATRTRVRADDARAALINILSDPEVGDGLTQNVLRDRMNDRGVSFHRARQAIRKAIDDGTVRVDQGPNKSQLHVLAGDR
ncbi:hypothetical protein AWB93_13065 [Mycobacterium bohemicum]|uniref:Uncharacterized protein n=1 Tax=Mycobacterium bohemicum TaxID=56425 RepID=A0A1X1R383_MYCBE|nr:hypothetical protein AWB93_13065 [Mycobacterium bohemicum]